MEIIYSIIFFIITFNYLIINIIYKFILNEKIFTNKIQCYENYWFAMDRKLNKIILYFFVDNNNNMITCNQTVNNTIKVNCLPFYPNLKHPCVSAINKFIKFNYK